MDSGSNECRSLHEEGQGARPWRITAPREQAGNLEPHEKKKKTNRKEKATNAIQRQMRHRIANEKVSVASI